MLIIVGAVVVAVVLLILAIRFCIADPKCSKLYQLTDKIVVITDGNSKLGAAVTRSLAMRGARIIMGCRDVEAGRDAALDLKADTNCDIQVHLCDPSSLRSIRQFCARIMEDESEVHVLINTSHVQWVPNVDQDGAGGGSPGSGRSRHSLIGPESKGVFEAHWTGNYLSSFAFAQLLMPLLRRGANSSPLKPLPTGYMKHLYSNPPNQTAEVGGEADSESDETVKSETFNSRIICLTSVWHRYAGQMDCEAAEIGRLATIQSKQDSLRAYAQSMRANLMFCQELGRRSESSNINTYCIDIGPVSSGLDLKSLFMCRSNVACPMIAAILCCWLPFLKRPSNAAQTISYCASEWPNLNSETGQIYRKCKRISPIQVDVSNDVQSDTMIASLELTKAKRLWEMTERQVLLSS